MKIYIGTSGWSYEDWKGVFYPKDLSSKKYLGYFSEHFKTAEVNASFYHLMKEKTYQNWKEQTEKDFIFAVKASRFITHIKRLKSVKRPWKKFIKGPLNLEEKLGPILFQFPESFRADEKNIKRLKEFLEYVKGRENRKLKLAFEFRHNSWFEKKIYRILRKYKVSLVIADSKEYPRENISTANFVYFRYHGPRELFGSKYSKKQLGKEAKIIKKFLNKNKSVYVYFNNDFKGYAVKNAQELEKLL